MITSKYAFIYLGIKQFLEATTRIIHEPEEFHKRLANPRCLNFIKPYASNDSRANLNNPSNSFAHTT